MLPCVLFEDDDLLVVNKPPGLNTHAPSPYAGEGLYEWLRHREARWAKLAIIHRLDKETSGVMVFSKSEAANRSLTGQFTRRAVHKRYLLLTDRAVPDRPLTVRSSLVRAGERYLSRPVHAGGELAETRFAKGEGRTAKDEGVGGNVERGEERRSEEGGMMRGIRTRDPLGKHLQPVVAEPLTGRTHQIRVQAAESGFPILGDTLYGGTAASRVYLHAAEITLRHPSTGAEIRFEAPADFESDARGQLRVAVVDPQETNAFRLIHGASDGWPGWYVELLGEYLLSQSEGALSASQTERLAHWMQSLGARGVYHKQLSRQVRRTKTAEVSPQLVLGEAAPERFTIRENGVLFELSFEEGYSGGLFLDQRDNRRRLLTGHVAAGFELGGTPATGSASAHEPRSAGFQPAVSPISNRLAPRNPGRLETSDTAAWEAAPREPSAPLEVLNTFAYTCGFSVCAARAGAHTTSLDLSRKYLEWGKRNFALNQLPLEGHDFIYGDTFDWLRRLGKKGRQFDVVVLDPPTFSQSKESGLFRAEKDYGKLVSAALPLLRSEGVLLASTNAAEWAPEAFLRTVEGAIAGACRQIVQRHYAPQPPDFPVSRREPAYLKTVWLRVR